MVKCEECGKIEQEEEFNQHMDLVSGYIFYLCGKHNEEFGEDDLAI